MLISTTLVNRCSWGSFCQVLIMSVKGSTRKLPAVLISFGVIWSSLMALFMLMHFINFNMSVVVTSEKEKHFACSECFLMFSTLGWYLHSSKIVLIAVKKVILSLSRKLSGFLLAVFTTTFMQALFRILQLFLHYFLHHLLG